MNVLVTVRKSYLLACRDKPRRVLRLYLNEIFSMESQDKAKATVTLKPLGGGSYVVNMTTQCLEKLLAEGILDIGKAVDL